jgi:hypothetical protein
MFYPVKCTEQGFVILSKAATRPPSKDLRSLYVNSALEIRRFLRVAKDSGLTAHVARRVLEYEPQILQLRMALHAMLRSG